MAERIDWSREEVEACVADYLRMLTLELNGQRYNKTKHANALMNLLQDRNRASVEFKHANISAVMVALGYPYIDGYKPRGNYQAMLVDAVEAQLMANDELQAAAQAAVTRPAAVAAMADPAGVWVPTPKPVRVRESAAGYAPNFSPAKRDYLAQEARNRSLGRAGELFIVELEARRLHAAGKKTLADRVEHVAATLGDGLGFDVLSFREQRPRTPDRSEDDDIRPVHTVLYQPKRAGTVRGGRGNISPIPLIPLPRPASAVRPARRDQRVLRP